MSRQVRFETTAQEDFDELYEWIADHGGLAAARRYNRRLQSYCESFTLFPERGTRRDDIMPGLRLIGFERRVTIAFTVTATEVVILRILYGGRDIGLLATDQDA
jgi:toxin ParE1/3/4